MLGKRFRNVFFWLTAFYLLQIKWLGCFVGFSSMEKAIFAHLFVRDLAQEGTLITALGCKDRECLQYNKPANSSENNPTQAINVGAK